MRINFPSTFSEWFKLFKKLKPKVLALATPNTIDSYMTENGVDLTADDTAVNDADTANTAAEEKEKSAEEHTLAGKLKMKQPMKDHRKCCQNLKSIYRTNPRKLGDWGVTVDNESKIVYSTNADEHAVEIKALITKHNTYAAGTSPLQPLLDEEGIDLTQNGTDIDDAITEFDSADADSATKEAKIVERNNKINPVIEHIRGIGQAAVKMYASNPKKAGDLGFVIDSSKQPPVLRTITLEAGQEVDYGNLDVGSFVAVQGDGEIGIRPKNKPDVPLTSVSASQKFLLARGFGKSVLKNLSSTKKVTFSAEFHK
ncbi:MAG: hypothetical protein ACHQHP_06370 [Bacteroidia bacterium]